MYSTWELSLNITSKKNLGTFCWLFFSEDAKSLFLLLWNILFVIFPNYVVKLKDLYIYACIGTLDNQCSATACVTVSIVLTNQFEWKGL
jgi:hypothetical protein